MIFSRKGKKNNAGFTLVEMIVVLIILGILASAAVFGIISYINLTRYNNNQENAESVYQSIQASLNHMSENGTLESWAKELSESIGTADEFDSNNPAASETSDNVYNKGYFDFFGSAADTNSLPGQSAHMRYAVTYYPSYAPGNNDPQSKCIYDLIVQDFKATDILKGLITVEFDVEKALDSTGTLRYSASVYSVFYDSNRTVWDAVAKNDIDTLKVPFRDESYRSGTSLIGYIAGRNGQMVVDSVFVPAEAEVNDFTIRNGETLDITWSVNSDGQPVTGKPDHIHYTFALYDDDKRNVLNQKPFCYLVVNENSLFEGKPYETLYDKGFYELLKFSDDTNPLYMAKDTFQNGLTRSLDFATHTGTEHFVVVYTKESVTDKRGIPLTVYRASIHTVGRVFVHKDPSGTDTYDYNNDWNNVSTAGKYYEFPLTISYEIYDAYGTTISEKLSYTLSLDAMMSRNILDIAKNNSNTERLYNFSFNRLINGNEGKLKDSILPVNFFVSMVAESDNFGSTHQSFNRTSTYASDILFADRALDDPVYYVSEGNYSYVRNAAYREAGRGYAVVNAYFGDLGKGSDGTKPSETVENSNTYFNQDSVITSYRHLYNIRMLDSHTGYDHYYYRIQRDLNWYTIDKHLGTEKYYSEVIVYSAVSGGTSLNRYSPVPIPAPSNDPASRKLYGDQLAVVSFPSIYNLNAKSVIIAEENSLTGETSVINNVQMRLSSFFNKDNIANKLHGFGLININRGTLINIRANGMTLTLDNKPEGSPDDRAAIAQAVSLMLTGEINSTDAVTFEGSSPIGGLVGTNVGTVGSDEDLPVEENTIRFSNCITTSLFRDSSDNWHLYRVSACGGIVGDNGSSVINNTTLQGNMNGRFEATGHFVSAGMYDVGSVLGYSMSDINAFIRVDNRESDQDKIIVDLGSISSMLYCTCDAVGGAIGSISNSTLIQDSKIARLAASADDRGVLTVAEDPLYNSGNPLNRHEYAVDVYLDANSYIFCKTDEGIEKTKKREAGIGGVIGRINTYGGGDISLRVVNNGVIAASAGTSYIKNLGGAVGIITGGTVKEANIFVMNGSDSKIGTITGTSAYGYTHTTGGAVGKIHNIARVNDNSNIIISSVNNGAIFGDCTHNGSQLNTGCDRTTGGIGGAVGAITGAQNSMPICNIRAYNDGTLSGSTNSLPLTDAAYNNSGLGGAVGYIQYMPKSGNIYSILKPGKEIRANGNNAGGCVGCLTGDLIANVRTAYTRITADLSNGSSVVSTASNAGGSIGNAHSVSSYLQARSIISGSVNVRAAADAGGVCGIFRSDSYSQNSEVILQQGTGNSYLYVKTATLNGLTDEYLAGNENAGGLIGYVIDGRGALNTGFALPTQADGNQVVINVESYDNAGGMIGHLQNFKATNSEMAMNIHPMMQVHAHNENAGGIIGFLESRNGFKSNVTAADAASINSDYTPVIKADISNAGGLIGGSIYTSAIQGTLLLDSANIAINGGNNVGGCIGYAAREAGSGTRASIIGSVTVKGTTKQRTAGTSCIVISGSECVGGVIGCTDNVDIQAPILCDVEMIAISGTSNIGGVFGKLFKGNFNTSNGHAGSITLTGTAATILGESNVGGCIGVATDIGNVSNSILFSGENSTVKGTVDSCGGVIGILNNCSVKNSSSIKFSGKNSAVTGENNVGGVIGLFSAEAASMSCQGSVIFSPIEGCTVTGNNNIGGCFGTVSAGSSDPFTRKPSVSLTDCNAEISGPGCVGGVAGRLQGGKTFIGSEITLSASVLTVNSRNSAGGGHIGYMSGMTISGNNAELITTCNNRSTFNIIGKTSCGGMIGQADSNVTAKRMRININGSSTVSVQATGSNSGAGGLIGVNGAVFTGPDEDTSVSNGSGLSISAPNGYAGYLVGINNTTFKGINNRIYTLNASIGACSNSGEADEDKVIGQNNGTQQSYRYKVDGTTYSVP